MKMKMKKNNTVDAMRTKRNQVKKFKKVGVGKTKYSVSFRSDVDTFKTET